MCVCLIECFMREYIGINFLKNSVDNGFVQWCVMENNIP